MAGRPTDYTQELGEAICARLAGGESLRSICRDEDMPDRVTVHRWVLSENEVYRTFRHQYALARQIQAETIADEIFDITDDGSNDWMEREGKDGGGGWALNGEHVQRSKLRVDARKWYLSKMLPRFEDRKTFDHQSSDGSMKPTHIQIVAPDDDSAD